MPSKLNNLAIQAEPRGESRSAIASHLASLADLQARLREWFGVQFELFDGNSGDSLAAGAQTLTRDVLVLGEICRAVAGGGKAEIVEENEPLVVLAIPVRGDQQQMFVAVASFLTGHSTTPPQLAHIADGLQVRPDAARRWLAEQQVWQPTILLGMGQLATERLAAEWRLRTMDREVRDLTLNLSTTYEEISLIYRLTQNLKLSSRTDELAALAIEWLSEVVPAECLAVQLLPGETAISQSGRSEPTLLTYGTCPIDSADLNAMLAHFELKPGKRPLIVNESQSSAPTWPWPQVRQLIAVSLCEGSNCFGWLVAINHDGGGEFGTVEASLLSSVGAILGIHGGNAELYQQQHELFKGILRALTSAIDAKDPYTCGHSERVARAAVRLAEEIGCNRQQVDTIYLAGLLHDIGKIGIDDNVLRKPGKLTDAEYEHIKTHAEIGHRILRDIKQLDEVLPVVLHHHEQWNGKGYPRMLAGEAIPLLARIMAVADSFDAMSSDRPYRQGMPDDKLDAIFRQGSGEQWDARIVEAFFRLRDEMRTIADRTAAPQDPRELV